MATFNDLVEDTLAHLRGYVRDQELSTYTTASMTNSVLTMTVNDATVVSRGRVEVDDELLYVDSIDRGTKVATIPPYGRGMDGSTAATHATSSKVTVNPIFPRVRVRNAVNETILALDGELFGVASTTFPYSATQFTYSLPAAAQDVLYVQYEAPWDTPEWFTAKRWTFNRMADTTDFASGRSITISDVITPGMTVRVTYTSSLTALSAGTDDFTTSGLRLSAKDCVVLGAVNRLLLVSEAFRLNTRAVEPNQLDLRTQPGNPSQLSKYVYQLFRQRVAEERTKLLADYPVRIHHSAR